MALDLEHWLNDVLRKHVQYRENKVCIVSIIGKSPISGFWNKVNPINDLLGRKAFENIPCANRRDLEDGSQIEAYFDAELQTVFLHLISPYDLGLQQQAYPAEGERFHTFWMKKEELYAAHLLTLFLSSHIVVLMHPTCRLDTSYFRLLRTLEYTRGKTQSAVCDILAEISGVSKGWAGNGRLCTPRLLFGFHRPPTFMRADGTVETRQGPYRKVERCLEDQIYALFRKSRLITNNTTNALVSLPANQSFVHVFPPMDEPRDIVQLIMNNFRPITVKEQREGGDAGDSSRNQDDPGNVPGTGFKEFLLEHIDLAHSDGFNDNMAKLGPSFFELPKLKSFVRGLGGVYDYFVIKYHDNIELEELPDSLDVMARFSEERCKKVFPIAISAYMDGLPQYYSSMYHKAKLAQALQVLHHQARGPSLETACTQLIEECEEYWRNDHQACEQLSLTGNPCVNRIHRANDYGSNVDTNEEDRLPFLRHTSKIKYLSTCNCGRRQAWRDDPFYLREANYDFYEWRDEFECCRRRVVCRIDYPVYVGRRSGATYQEEPNMDKEMEESSEEKEEENDTEMNVPDETDVEHKKRTKAAEKMFDRLKLATQSQEERNQGQGPSAGDDFLPDRDNRPAGSGRNEGSASLADTEEFASANATNFAERETAVKTQEDRVDRRRRVDSIGDGIDNHTSGQFHRSWSDEKPVEHETNFAVPLDDNEVTKDARPTEDDNDDSSSGPGNGSENEQPMDEIERENAVQTPDPSTTRTSSRAAEAQVTDNRGRRWEEEDDQPRRKRSEIDQCPLEDAKEGVDYQTGMVNSQCPDILPLFSSWSLVCIGSSSVYSHSHGLRDQPNFSHGSNFLMPWDVELQVDIDRWQEQMEMMAANTLKRMGPYKKPRQPKQASNGAVTVKVFIGFEYECPRGHRFMMQTPDRILKHALSSGGGPKENGGILIKSDTRLWFPCSCRQTKSGFPGQLMRVHIVTPKAPVVVTVNPRVQPRPSTPGKPPLIFHPGAPGPAKLPAAQYWILRLPFVYVGPEGPCYPPRDNADCSGRVLRGMINVFPDLDM